MLSLGSGNSGRRSYSEDRRKNDRRKLKSVLPSILPAPPTVARMHRSYAPPSLEKQDLELHISRLKSRLHTLLQARESNALA